MMIIKANVKDVWIQRFEEALKRDDANAGLSLTHEAAEQILEIIKQSEQKMGEWSLTYDAVEVVRCQHCKHGYFAGTALYCDKQSRSHAWHKAAINWFCADGKRREDE